MNSLLPKAGQVNGGAVSARAVAHSHLTESQLLQIAADAVTATTPWIPSVEEMARETGLSPVKISQELNLRAERQRAMQARKLAECLKILSSDQLDAVVEEVGVGRIWDAVDRLTR